MERRIAMGKFTKITSILLCLALLWSIGIFAFASEEPATEESGEEVDPEVADILPDTDDNDTEIYREIELGAESSAEPEIQGKEEEVSLEEEDNSDDTETVSSELPDAEEADVSIAIETETDTYTNPLYSDLPIQEEFATLYLDDSGTDTSDYSTNYDSYCTTVEEAAVAIREGMKRRQGTVKTSIKSDIDTSSTVYTSIFEEAIKHTGVPTEGDYLQFNYSGYQVSSIKLTDKRTNTYYYTFTFSFTYMDSAEEEAAVDVATEALISSLTPEDDSQYALIRAVYDKVTSTVDYDFYHDSSYLTKYSTYAAAVLNLAVCQGYVSYMYRLLLTLGIPCRIIRGTTQDGSLHGWNIVEIDGLYYNVDATWDAGFVNYSYFLKNEEDFSVTHKRNTTYTTEEFMTEYPMSSVDYKISFFIVGDLYEDYSVNAKDAQYFYKYITGYKITSYVNESVADLNNDNTIDYTDDELLYRYLMGWDDDYGIGEQRVAS
jgi:hypothetical protein